MLGGQDAVGSAHVPMRGPEGRGSMSRLGSMDVSQLVLGTQNPWDASPSTLAAPWNDGIKATRKKKEEEEGQW